jgi:hypothetical protein
MQRIDICYLAHNRIEFTRASFAALIASATPRERIIAFVDNDEQGSAAEIRSMLRAGDEVVEGKWGGPVAITNAFLDMKPSRIFAKVDNDLVVCPGWVDACLSALQAQPEFSFVGIEPGSLPPQIGGNKIKSAAHVGGIGIFRREAFDKYGRPVASGRFGFTEWQYKNTKVLRGWLTPPLPVFLLDHLPMEPWLSLSKQYRSRGWERETWGVYGPGSEKLWSWWLSK